MKALIALFLITQFSAGNGTDVDGAIDICKKIVRTRQKAYECACIVANASSRRCSDKSHTSERYDLDFWECLRPQ